MNENKYTKTVDSIHAPQSAVHSMLDTVQNYGKKEKFVSMTTIKRYVIAASLVALLALGTIVGFNVFGSKDNPFKIIVNASEVTSSNYTQVCKLNPVGGNYYQDLANKQVLLTETFALDVKVDGKKIQNVVFAGQNCTVGYARENAGAPAGVYCLEIDISANSADTTLPAEVRQAILDCYDHIATKFEDPVLQDNYDDSAFDGDASMKAIYDALFNRMQLDVVVTFEDGQSETCTLTFNCDGVDPETGLFVLSAKLQ